MLKKDKEIWGWFSYSYSTDREFDSEPIYN